MDEPIEVLNSFQEIESIVLGEHVFYVYNLPLISCGSAIVLFVSVYVCVGVEGISVSKQVM